MFFSRLAASLAAEEDMHLNKNGLASSRDGSAKQEADDAEDEEVIFVSRSYSLSISFC